MTSPAPSSASTTSTCPSCGGALAFAPNLGQLACTHCGHQVAIAAPSLAQSQALAEQDFDHWLQRQPSAKLSPEALAVQCPSCHAEITFTPPDIAGDCPFCNAHLTAPVQAANPVLTPGGILPFTVGRKAARVALGKWLKSRWFAPGALKELAQYERLQGVYLPFWTYDCQTTTTYRGDRGEYYDITKTRRVQNDKGKWHTETYKERNTRWHPTSGRVSRWFDDVLIPAITSVNIDDLKALEDWPLDQLVPYDAAYLTGFRVQRSQISLAKGFDQAKVVMASRIKTDIKRDIGGDDQRIQSQSTTYQDQRFKQILLPVWLVTYRYKNQPYQVMIHGTTAQVVGAAPNIFGLIFSRWWRQLKRLFSKLIPGYGS